jgi:hypothetical protein
MTVTNVLLVVIIFVLLAGFRKEESKQEKELRELLRSELKYRALQRDGDIEIHRDRLSQARERAGERGKEWAKKFAEGLSSDPKKSE